MIDAHACPLLRLEACAADCDPLAALGLRLVALRLAAPSAALARHLLLAPLLLALLLLPLSLLLAAGLGVAGALRDVAALHAQRLAHAVGLRWMGSACVSQDIAQCLHVSSGIAVIAPWWRLCC